jgi:hypothetical protein
MKLGGLLKNVVGAVAPTLGTALAGPMGGMAANMIADVLGVPNTPKAIEKAVQNATPEQMLELKKAEQAFELQMKELDVDVFQLINEVGFPIAAAIGLGLFIWKLINKIIDGMETKVDVLDEKVSAQISEIEQRLGQKLDSQHGILVALIDRVRSVDNEIIRQDTLLKTILGVPQLMHTDRLAKADRDDQRKD